MLDLVSVIIPTYGGGDFLQRAVDSVLAQTHKNIEVIVVDDNGLGTENQLKTAKKMEMYASYDNVYYICHEKNKNGSAARNTGFLNSHGQYIALLDDDDAYTANNIQTQYSVLRELSEDYALTYCSNERYIGEKKVGESHVSKSGNLLYEVLMHKATIGSTSLLIRRCVWEKLNGFDESFKRHQDWEFTARVAADYKVKAVDNIGFIRYLEFRNSPKSIDIAKAYRLHYLDKMAPYINRLSNGKRKKVIVHNRLDIAIQHLKNKDFKAFRREYREIRPGFAGIKFLFGRMFLILKKKITGNA